MRQVAADDALLAELGLDLDENAVAAITPSGTTVGTALRGHPPRRRGRLDGRGGGGGGAGPDAEPEPTSSAPTTTSPGPVLASTAPPHPAPRRRPPLLRAPAPGAPASPGRRATSREDALDRRDGGCRSGRACSPELLQRKSTERPVDPSRRPGTSPAARRRFRGAWPRSRGAAVPGRRTRPPERTFDDHAAGAR